MSVFSGPATTKKVYPLMATGEYVATLSDLTYEQGGAYGDSLLWKWLLALPADPTSYIARDDGEEKLLHEYTQTDIVIGSKSHEWIKALTGKDLKDGDEPPDSDDLVGKRMLVYLAHLAPKQGPNAGVLRERFSPGTSKAFTLVPPKQYVANVPAKPAPTEDDTARAALVEEALRQVGKAVKLETPSHGDWIKADVENLADDALHMVIRDARAEVQAALDA